MNPLSLPFLSPPSFSSSDFSFEDVHLLCLGDIMLDRYKEGEVSRISPEAPVPIFQLKKESKSLGGVGNVAAGIAAYNARVSLWGQVGVDSVAQEVQILLNQSSQITPFLTTSRGPTIEKTRLVCQGQHLLRLDREEKTFLSSEERRRVSQEVQNKLSSCQGIILSDYGKGFLTPSLCQEIIGQARRLSLPVLVDPKGQDFSFYKGATLIKPNRQELALALGRSLPTWEDVVQGAREMRETLDLEGIIVTLSEEGMVWVPRKGEAFLVPAQARDVFDRVGAGDTVLATLGVALSKGYSWEKAVTLANQAAGLVVGKKGTSVVSQEELRKALLGKESHPEEGMPFSSKIMTLSEAQRRVQEWQKQGLTVGFTNGCFDLLHKGHLKILQEARATCDRLIVAINSDASVKKLKGPQRPVQSEEMRAYLVACQPFVEGVIIFSQETPEELIYTLKPQVLIKGADYKVDQVVGSSFVQSYGGKVVLVELLPHMSTTHLLQALAS